MPERRVSLNRAGAVPRALAGAALAVALATAHGQSPLPRPLIFSCTSEGKPITSDRPIANCDGEQRITNPDGSAYRLVPRSQSEEERIAEAAKETPESAADNARATQARRDRILLTRYPNETRFDEARKEALDRLRASIREAESRISQLNADANKLASEAGLFAGKPLPARLKTAIDASDASLSAERLLLPERRAELVRVEKMYDDELARLKKLWATN
jgi:hypothetical protein